MPELTSSMSAVLPVQDVEEQGGARPSDKWPQDDDPEGVCVEVVLARRPVVLSVAERGKLDAPFEKEEVEG